MSSPGDYSDYNYPRRMNSTNPRPGQPAFPRASQRIPRQDQSSRAPPPHGRFQSGYQQQQQQYQQQYYQQGQGPRPQQQQQQRSPPPGNSQSFEQTYDGPSYAQGAYYDTPPPTTFTFSRSRESFFRRDGSSMFNDDFFSRPLFSRTGGGFGGGLGGIGGIGGVAGDATRIFVGGGGTGGGSGGGLFNPLGGVPVVGGAGMGLGGFGLGGFGINLPMGVSVVVGREEERRPEERAGSSDSGSRTGSGSGTRTRRGSGRVVGEDEDEDTAVDEPE